MADPTWASSGTKLSTTTATPSFAVPSDVVADEIITVDIYLDGTTVAPSVLPSGFAIVNDSPVDVGNARLYSYWKRATGADSGTYDFTLSGSTFLEGQAIRYSNCKLTGSPWEADTDFNLEAAGPHSNNSPSVSITTTVDNALALHITTCWAGGLWTPSSGFTNRMTSGGFGLIQKADKSIVSAGSTGSVVAVCSNSDRAMAWLGALMPEPVNTFRGGQALPFML